ncbi:MAG TPA: hypothetical protein VNV88_12275 [Candidatus Solibacter sp.]|jgi:hypothetical protein|nr:hypothetical protein [Candidatus Solibacter sp.]
MRLVQRLCFVVLISSLVVGQNSTPATPPAQSSVADELKNLREAMAEQQKAIQEQQKAMAQQQDQISAQQREIERLKQQAGATAQAVSAKTAETSPRLVHATLTNATSTSAAKGISDSPAQDTGKSESPLSFRIGGAEFTPGGFVDFENIFRSENTGNAAATAFGAIPFSNTAAGHLTEFRSTGQYSRISLGVSSKFGANDVTGYVETDFNGNDAATVFQTTNPHTLRLRLYWLDVKRGKWEFLAGQSWGWLTPNKNGLSPVPSDLAITANEDANIHVGVHHTRAAQFRVAYHPNSHWAMGVALENQDQFVGAGTVTFPTAFTGGQSNLVGQFDNGNAGVPSLMPDIISKVAYDNDFSGRHLHLETAGLLTTAKATVVPTGSTGFITHSKVGGGMEAAANYELFKRFRLLTNGFYSDGGGRYLIVTGPQAVVLPNATGKDVNVSMVHSGGGMAGFEAQVTQKTLLSGYYGGFYFQRNFALDTTAGAKPNTFVGYGGPNSTNADNRAIQEATLGLTQTFWRSRQYGAVLLVNQYSYLTRAPWFVAPGAPKNAHLVMGYVSLRYILP